MRKVYLFKSQFIIIWMLVIAGQAVAQQSPDHLSEVINNKTWNIRALANEGNASRIANVMLKARKGESITIGLIGGSITAGYHASDLKKTAYGPLVFNWWQSRFPNANIKFINAGIGATNSIYGVHRADNDLLKYEPDFVIVEFSVNDNGEDYAMEAYEGLVRRILKSKNKPAVLCVATMDKKGENWQQQHLPVCYHYNLPMLSYRDAIWPEINSGNLKWTDISPDDLHPNNRGHSYIAGIVIHYLNNVFTTMDVTSKLKYRIPSPLTENGYEKSRFLFPVSNISLPQNWHLENEVYKATTKGEPLIFTVKGGYISVMFKKTNKPVGAKAYVLIDGEKRIDMDADFAGGWGDYNKLLTLIHDKDKRKHTLAFYYNDERPNKEFIISNILVANF